MRPAIKRDSFLKNDRRAPINNQLPTTIDIPNATALSIDDLTKMEESFMKDEGLDDIMEYHIDTSRYSKKETVTMVSHDFNQVEASASAQVTQHVPHSESTTSASSNKETLVGQDTTTSTANSSVASDSDSDDDEEWKDMSTQVDLPHIYNLKGDKVDSFIYNKPDVQEPGSGLSALGSAGSDSTTPTATKHKSGVFNKMLFNSKSTTAKEQQQQRLRSASTRESESGYTRIAGEAQATKYQEMDSQFDYLFKPEHSNLRKLQDLNSTASFGSSTSVNNAEKTDQRRQSSATIISYDSEDDNALSPSNQMATTKSLLTDSQKIAYAALVKLIIVRMHEELNKIRGSGSVQIMEKLAKAQKSFTNWSMRVMDLLYDHLGIKEAKEREMIELLSCHGVEVDDLTTWMDSHLTVNNNFKNLDSIKADVKMIDFHKDKETENIEVDVRWTLICDLFLILLESSVYDSRSRTLLLNFGDSIAIKNLEIYNFERRITDSLEVDETMDMVYNEQQLGRSDILKEHKKRAKTKKLVKIGLATAAGGLVIGLSAGLLAPVIGAGVAAGLTTIGITGTSGFLAGTGGSAIIATGGVLTGMKIGAEGMAHRAGSVNTFEFQPLHNNGRVNLILTVSGWMSGTKDDIRLPFSTVDPVMGDLYSILWEPEMLTSMGQTIGIIANEVLTQSIQQILGSTILVALMSAIQLPMMLSKLSYILDNPWNVSLDRAWSAVWVLD
ncbi:unnamed protein product [Ambrosiozyma monospora]|uniref:Unnamed protein product n=1 Tax=Ambrosiozyma monospora TaxID=43982 RepID=A0A9W6YXX9_AMBMO|nr:unnamed protein product [Ambrosiozyma monospora]